MEENALSPSTPSAVPVQQSSPGGGVRPGCGVSVTHVWVEACVWTCQMDMNVRPSDGSLLDHLWLLCEALPLVTIVPASSPGVVNATFDNQPVFFSSGGSLLQPVSHVYVELRTRWENAIILRASWGSHMFLVGLLDASVQVEIQSGNNVETLTFTGTQAVADGKWHRVNVSMVDRLRSSSPWVITVDGIMDASSAPQRAGALRFLREESAVVAVAESFSGCLGALRVGGVYLPFTEQPGAPQQARFHSATGAAAAMQLGCVGTLVCSSNPCLNGGQCEDQFNQFSCICPPGWGGERCQSDLDDCASQPCAHGHCRDFLAGFQCLCQPGFIGRLCSEDVDDCENHACQHGGTCKDGVNAYTCICPGDYRGPLCQ